MALCCRINAGKCQALCDHWRKLRYLDVISNDGALQLQLASAKSAVDPDCKFLAFAIVIFQANRNKNESNYKSKLLPAPPIIYILHTCSKYFFCKKYCGHNNAPSAGHLNKFHVINSAATFRNFQIDKVWRHFRAMTSFCFVLSEVLLVMYVNQTGIFAAANCVFT